MNKFSFLVHLQDFADQNSTNNSTLNFSKFNINILPVDADKTKSEEFCLVSEKSESLWSSEKVLPVNSATQWLIDIKSGKDSTYILSWTGTETNSTFEIIPLTEDDVNTPRIVSVWDI
jgi:hypothetical protein